MMGGPGSGRRSGSGRDTLEACRSIDVNRLHREGCLRAGWIGGWQWTRDGEKLASINLRAEHDRLHLTYRVRVGGGEWEDVAETVRIVRAACRFGGTRPYFICPGVVNRSPVAGAKLHGPGRYFLCRHCYRLAYASQSECAWDRAIRRASKISQRPAPIPPSNRSHRSRNACGNAHTSGSANRHRGGDVADRLHGPNRAAVGRAQQAQTQKEILAMTETKSYPTG
jgi:hypothetical protein